MSSWFPPWLCRTGSQPWTSFVVRIPCWEITWSINNVFEFTFSLHFFYLCLYVFYQRFKVVRQVWGNVLWHVGVRGNQYSKDLAVPTTVQSSFWSSYVLFWFYISTVPVSFKLIWKGLHIFMYHRQLILKVESLKGFKGLKGRIQAEKRMWMVKCTAKTILDSRHKPFWDAMVQGMLC